MAETTKIVGVGSAPGVSVLVPRLLTIAQAADYLAATPWAVRRLIWQGALSYVKVGKRFTIQREVLDAWIERNTRREGLGFTPGHRVKNSR